MLHTEGKGAEPILGHKKKMKILQFSGCIYNYIRESVDSLCRDGPDTPIKPNKCNGSEPSNMAAISPFRNITWPTSVSIHDNSLKGDKIHRYKDIS